MTLMVLPLCIKLYLTDMKKYVLRLYALLLLPLLFSCIEDKSLYDYKKTNEVSFKTVLEGFSFTAGEEVEIVAPIVFSEAYEDETKIDEDFEILWYLGEECIGSGYRIRYTFEKTGGFALILKAVNRTTGETYLSGSYNLESKSAVGWGWMVLSRDEENNSCLSVIAPLNHHVFSSLESSIEGGLGKNPESLHYYYVLGSISGSYISGLPKVLVSQQSGNVTLDGNTLQKDKWLKDEFETGVEPETEMKITSFAWKQSYYLLFSGEGNVYLRCMPHSSKYTEIPYYGSYSSMPCSFDGGLKIGTVATFDNVTYWTADEDKVLIYDEGGCRFLAFVSGGYGDDYANYSPKIVYFSYYDSEMEIDPSVPKVNAFPSGTKCLGMGAYENVLTGEYGGLTFYPEYVALMDYGGAGSYYVYRFAVNPMGDKSHTIISNAHLPFSGSNLLTGDSLVKMSANFEKNPYFYFTDGDKALYVYSMEAGTHKLLYEASARITQICSSPLDCPFSKYGANSTEPNYRLALAQEGGLISFVDVGKEKMVRLFEGFPVDAEIASLSGFGEIKSVVWATNYEGEY